MEKNDFIEKICTFVEKHQMLRHDEGYLVAVSGGADSVVLLRVLLCMGYRCVVAHCNFHLRGEESDRDERFVTTLCKRLGVECLVTHFDVPAYEREHGVSTEMACRELRYGWFRSILCERGLSAILVAHHSDDNIETLFLNILRGSGIAGMTAMRPVNGDVRRPMLCVSRADIERYAVEIGQDFVTDSTNRESVVKRNRLRNVVLPLLREQFPDADSGILRTIENLRQCYGLYGAHIDELRRECLSECLAGDHVDGNCGVVVRIDLDRLAELSGDSLATAIFELTRRYGFNSAQAAEMAASRGSVAQSTGKKYLSSEYVAIINRGSLDIFQCVDEEDAAVRYVVDLRGSVDFPVKIDIEAGDAADFSASGVDGKQVVCFDASILDRSLELRHWRKGDRIRPFGMRGTRLVSDIFSDMKLSEPEKRGVWILTADGEIVWILGIRSSALYPVGSRSIGYLRLTFIVPASIGGFSRGR